MASIAAVALPDGVWDAVVAGQIIAGLAATPGAALPILHALQDEFGCVPKQAEPLIARALNISLAEVHGIISFYHDFRRVPPGRHVLKLCRAEACQSRGAPAIATRLLARLGISWGQTTADGGLTVEPVYCLGMCACGPSGLLDGQPLARLDDGALGDIADEARAA